MTNYIFLLELYFIMSALVFLYPRELWKRNHILNAIFIIFFLLLTDLFVRDKGIVFSFSDFLDYAIISSPDVLNDFSKIPKIVDSIQDKFYFSFIVTLSYFIIGRLLFFFNKISINSFDTFFTGLIPFILWFDFIVFIGLANINGFKLVIIPLIVFTYVFFSIGRIQLFMFLGIKNILDDIDFKEENPV